MAAISQFANGFRLFTGQSLNAIVDAVNNLTGNGTPAAITGTTGTFSGAVSTAALTPTSITGSPASTLGATTATNLTSNGTLTETPQIATAAGATQGTATAITKSLCIVTVALTASTKGVKLPTAATGLIVNVANLATFGVKVYPATNGKIGAASTNSADSTVLAINKANIYIAQNTTKWAVCRGA